MKLEELIAYKNKLLYNFDILLSNFVTKKNNDFDIEDSYSEITNIINNIIKIENVINNYLINVFEIQKEIEYNTKIIQTLNETKFVFDSNNNKVFNNIDIKKIDTLINKHYDIIIEKEKMYNYYLRITEVENIPEII